MRHPKLRSMTPSAAFNFFRRLPSKVDMLLSAIYISHSQVIIGARNTEAASECGFVLISGHFLLTKLLLDKMKSTAERIGIESRIVNLSSEAHMTTYRRGIRFDKLNDKDLKTLWMLIVADVILWRKKNVTMGILIGVLASWIICEDAEVLNRYTVVGVLSQSQADNPF
ncbi:hypothetical protein ZIOFF_023884 [Zingiber officinale]|uniref:Multiple C2 domain-containing protein n=1 Tax=Zingiber officinale TaxID=94328 RepID=A0A8J5GVE7_ZINOF|nr:hypothetical protein ZIOFF_023884 [Zingiber officinale]